MSKLNIIIIGGGAAGFFSAINIAEKIPEATITILEKTQKLLAKVRISGGGRCNVTNGRKEVNEIIPFYPRGQKKLYKAFKNFGPLETQHWFNKRGVELHIEKDLRVFPLTNSSETIIDCFMGLVKQHNISVKKGYSFEKLVPQTSGGYLIETNNGNFEADIVVMATGSSPQVWQVLSPLELKIVPPVPSLFTFKIEDKRLQDLSGVAFPAVEIAVNNTKLKHSGPLLITHWGLSGPCIIQLSSLGARELAELAYKFDIRINFTNQPNDSFRSGWNTYKQSKSNLKIKNQEFIKLPQRFFLQLLQILDIDPNITFSQLQKKDNNRLVEQLTQGQYEVTGKSPFKEEFVTAGGLDLSEIDMQCFEAKKYPHLYFAGEMLNIDALTGGFNFQACWTAGYAIANDIHQKSTTTSS